MANATLEKMAEVEYEQWRSWAKTLLPELKRLVEKHVSYCACETCRRIKRWELLLPASYAELSEEAKEQSRVWARIVLDVLREGKEKKEV